MPVDKTTLSASNDSTPPAAKEKVIPVKLAVVLPSYTLVIGVALLGSLGTALLAIRSNFFGVMMPLAVAGIKIM